VKNKGNMAPAFLGRCSSKAVFGITVCPSMLSSVYIAKMTRLYDHVWTAVCCASDMCVSCMVMESRMLCANAFLHT
jgi:hypothetical protein